MQITGEELHMFTQEPKFRKHFDYNKCIMGWCSKSKVCHCDADLSNVHLDEYMGHIKNDRIDFRFDTAWLNQFQELDECNDFNYIVIDGNKTFLRDLKDITELKELVYKYL